MAWFQRLLVPSSSLLVWAAAVCLILGATAGEEDNNEDNNGWTGCNMFLAPSTMGWSVYAARPFAASEVVEVVPMFLPVAENARVAKNTVIDDYAYGYVREDKDSGESMIHHNILVGMGMFYNHHPNPNVQPVQLGEASLPHVAAFQAKRDIAAGEELFASYGLEDEGRVWFQQRGLVMSAPEGSWIGSSELETFKSEFCSKIYTGPGTSTLKDTMQIDSSPLIDYSRIAPFDADLGNAKSKKDVAAGERLDMTIGLPLPTEFVEGTMFAAFVFSFEDFDVESHKSLIILRNSGQLKIPYKGIDTNWGTIDIFGNDFSTLSILPVGGNIGMVQRVGEDDPTSNCRIHISWEGSNSGSAGILLELIATKNIAVGEVLKMSMPPSKSTVGYDLLKAELDEQGWHPNVGSFFPDRREEL